MFINLSSRKELIKRNQMLENNLVEKDLELKDMKKTAELRLSEITRLNRKIKELKNRIKELTPAENENAKNNKDTKTDVKVIGKRRGRPSKKI